MLEKVKEIEVIDEIIDDGSRLVEVGETSLGIGIYECYDARGSLLWWETENSLGGTTRHESY